MQSFPRMKRLIGLILIFLTLGFSNQAMAQIRLVQDSWSNAGKWFKASSYHKNDALYWGLGTGAIGLVMAHDSFLQSKLELGNSNLQSQLGPVFEPFGNPMYIGSAGLITYIGAELAGAENLSELSSVALQSMLTGSAVVLALKLAFHRERPEEQDAMNPYVFHGPSFRQGNLSFPSGHTVIAFSAASSISAYYGDPWYLAVPLYTVAGLTAWQRVFDHKHWPSDVFTGALIGVFVGRKIAKWQKEKEGRISNIQLTSMPGSRFAMGMQIALD